MEKEDKNALTRRGALGQEVRDKKLNEILRYAIQVDKPITPNEISEKFEISYPTAQNWLLELAAKGYFRILEHGYYKFFMPNKDFILKKMDWEYDLIVKKV